jgi:hypothetical protein
MEEKMLMEQSKAAKILKNLTLELKLLKSQFILMEVLQ